LATGTYFDRVEQIELPHWSKGRVVLLGDACQCVSPLAGQGASLAVAAAYFLAARLNDHSDLREGLAVYERTLKPFIKRRQAAARRIARWVIPTNEGRLWMRNATLRASAWSPVAAILRQGIAADNVVSFLRAGHRLR
jgi:2-polyprenyl-6-methoxyphenol hydroxylase-like FAD-dependent oxidoreductase